MTEEFEVTYERPTNPNAIRNAGTTFSFRADQMLAQATYRATEVSGFRFTSEFIRASIIEKIERVIQSS
jgi:hypothetical protein